jgi:predicted Fe-S protein YdhL (DUF1289 family)
MRDIDDPRARDEDVPSPCISVCRLDPSSGCCSGCLRTLHEIATWSTMSAPAKRAVLGALPARRERAQDR